MHNQKFGKNVFGFGFGEEHHTIPLQFVVRLDKFLTRSNLFFRTEQTNKQTNKQTTRTYKWIGPRFVIIPFRD